MFKSWLTIEYWCFGAQELDWLKQDMNMILYFFYFFIFLHSLMSLVRVECQCQSWIQKFLSVTVIILSCFSILLCSAFIRSKCFLIRHAERQKFCIHLIKNSERHKKALGETIKTGPCFQWLHWDFGFDSSNLSYQMW